MAIYVSYHLIQFMNPNEDTTTWVTTTSVTFFRYYLGFDDRLWLSWFLSKILMLQMTLWYVWTSFDVLLSLFILHLFIIFFLCIFLSMLSYLPCCNIFMLHLSFVFMFIIFVSANSFILSIFTLALGRHLAMWCTLVSMYAISSFLIYFLSLILCSPFMSYQVIL